MEKMCTKRLSPQRLVGQHRPFPPTKHLMKGARMQWLVTVNTCPTSCLYHHHQCHVQPVPGRHWPGRSQKNIHSKLKPKSTFWDLVAWPLQIIRHDLLAFSGKKKTILVLNMWKIFQEWIEFFLNRGIYFGSCHGSSFQFYTSFLSSTILVYVSLVQLYLLHCVKDTQCIWVT